MAKIKERKEKIKERKVREKLVKEVGPATLLQVVTLGTLRQEATKVARGKARRAMLRTKVRRNVLTIFVENANLAMTVECHTQRLR